MNVQVTLKGAPGLNFVLSATDWTANSALSASVVLVEVNNGVTEGVGVSGDGVVGAGVFVPVGAVVADGVIATTLVKFASTVSFTAVITAFGSWVGVGVVLVPRQDASNREMSINQIPLCINVLQ